MRSLRSALLCLAVLSCTAPTAPTDPAPELAFSRCSTPPCGGGASKASAALQFDGVDDAAQTPDAAGLDLSATWTLEAWIQPSDVSRSAFQHVISKWGPGGNASYTLEVHAGKLRSGIHDGVNPTQAVESSGSLVNGAWQHVAISFDQGTLRLYIDGQLDRTSTNSQAPMNSERPVSIGREGPSCNCWPFAGLIDEVRIWNVARSAKEIARSMDKKLSNKSRGLVAYWRLNEGSGQLAADESRNGHDMQLGDGVGADSADPTWVSPGR
jgi:hypothetical protein